ncbi:hypothetical protein MNBD_BACTEROID07-995, partial [hydrothermal vent metagenome]
MKKAFINKGMLWLLLLVSIPGVMQAQSKKKSVELPGIYQNYT